jgi:hypothetical protein
MVPRCYSELQSGASFPGRTSQTSVANVEHSIKKNPLRRDLSDH